MAGEGICQAGEDTTLASKDGNNKNQACNRGDIEVTREGEETSLLDLKSRGDDKENQASDRGNTEANREGGGPRAGPGDPEERGGD